MRKNSGFSEFLNKVYPVGSIYFSVTNTNPDTLFGGTWVAWGSGKVPVGIDTKDNNFNAVEKTGGASSQDIKHTHGLSNGYAAIGYNDSNTNFLNMIRKSASIVPNNSMYAAGASGLTWNVAQVATTNATQLGGSTDNSSISSVTTLPPYITCYMWKRTA